MDNVKLRRYENLLIMSGTGVVIFGLWSIIKTILICMLRSNEVLDLLSDIPDSTVFIVLFYIILGIMLMGVLGIRLFIGLSARSEGMGKKKRYAYLVLAFILFFINIVTLIFSLDVTLYDTVFDMIVTLIVDLTSVITLTEMIVAAFAVKKLRKKEKAG